MLRVPLSTERDLYGSMFFCVVRLGQSEVGGNWAKNLGGGKRGERQEGTGSRGEFRLIFKVLPVREYKVPTMPQG